MKLNSESISTIAKSLVAAQKEMGNAVKDSKNPFFKSSYADLNAVREAVLPSFNKNGISVIQPTIFHDGKKFVQTVLLHESGEFISGLTEILSAKELDAQAQGSGISYARRYGLQSLANVGAEDDDGQAAVGKPSKDYFKDKVVAPQKSESGTTIPGTNLTVDVKNNGSIPNTTTTLADTGTRRSFRKTTTETL